MEWSKGYKIAIPLLTIGEDGLFPIMKRRLDKINEQTVNSGHL